MGDEGQLLNILEELSTADYEKFLFYLGDLIPASKRENISRVNLTKLFQRYYPDKMLNITAQLLQKIPRKDLLEKFHLKPKHEGETSEHTARADEEKVEEAWRAGETAPREGSSSGSKKKKASLQLVTDQQLMKLTENIGKDWKEIGIRYLEIQNSKLDQIEEENINNVRMKIFQMLKAWRTRVKNEATAARLCEILSEPLPPEAIDFLIEQE